MKCARTITVTLNLLSSSSSLSIITRLIDTGYTDPEITEHTQVKEHMLCTYCQNLRNFGQLNRPNGGAGRPQQLSCHIEDVYLHSFVGEIANLMLGSIQVRC